MALQAARERGTRLGATNPRSRNLTETAMQKGRKRGAEATAKRAREFYAEVVPKVDAMRRHGLKLAAIADVLNDEGYRTQTGANLGAVHVKRILDRQLVAKP